MKSISITSTISRPSATIYPWQAQDHPGSPPSRNRHSLGLSLQAALRGITLFLKIIQIGYKDGKNSLIIQIMLLVSLCAYAQQQQISYIDNDGRWYHVYDTDGKKITTQLDRYPRQELQGHLHSRSEIKIWRFFHPLPWDV